MGFFARGAFIFMNSGSGPYPKLLVLNDLFPMASRLLPTVRLASSAFALSSDAADHAHDRMQAALMLEPLSDLLTEIEDGNAECNPARGLEGPAGNFSGVVRRSCRQLADGLGRQVVEAEALGAPQRCIQALSAKSTMTLDCETYFTGHRRHYVNPSMLQYAQTAALAMEVEACANGQSAFSFFTGDERRYRGHYHLQGVQAVAAPRRQPAKPKPKQLESAIRKKRLYVLRELAATFKQSRSERVTAKGRERSGTLPAFAYGPSAVPPRTASERERPKLSSGRQTDAGGASSSAGSGASGDTAEVLYRAGDVVFVQAVSGGMWVAQLTEPVVRTTGADGTVTFNTDRPAARYFVRTVELQSYPHALQLWMTGSVGIGRRLADGAAALQRAGCSDGVHFSFEKPDRVTRTAVRGRFDGGVSEQQYHRSQLVSFVLTEAAVAEAHATTSGGASEAIEPDEDDDEEARMEAARLAAAAVVSAAAREQSYDAFAHKRMQGYARQQAARAARVKGSK